LRSAFGEDWWLWLVFTGWSIGCVCSIKWVGAFVTALVGIYTIEDLWDKFGDLRMPIVSLPCVLVFGRYRRGFAKPDLAHIHQALGRAYRRIDRPPVHRLRRLLQDALPRP
jgi:hypothetical protein